MFGNKIFFFLEKKVINENVKILLDLFFINILFLFILYFIVILFISLL